MQPHFLSQIKTKIKWLMGRNGLIQLWIAVTYNCQCRCEHCVVGPELNEKTDDLSQNEIYNILKDARSLGIRRVSFFGGEPLLRRDLPDIIRDTKKVGLRSTIYTNGLLLSEDNVKSLKEAGLDRCNVSLDSSDSNTHDQFRHYKGCFDKAIEGIGYLLKANISTSIWTHVSKKDVSINGLSDMKRLIQMGREIGVSNIMILFPMASGNWLCGWDEILTKEERERVRELLDPPFVRMEFPHEMTTCKGGRLFAYIKPDGNVTPCPTVPNVFGNVRQESLRKILQRINKDYCCFTKSHQGDCVLNDPSFCEKLSNK